MQHETLDRPGDYIGGRFCVSTPIDGELRIASPADPNDITAIHPYGRAALASAIASARAAFPAWRRLPASERAAMLRRYQACLRAHHADLCEVIAREVGKPLWEAKSEVDAMIAKVDLTLGEGARYTEDRALPNLPGEVRFKPHGVIVVIGPFNFPGHLPNGQIVPALALGNAVIHKPSERTPSMATWLARCFDEAGCPPGVFNVVQGPGEIGAELAEHAEVDGVMFTGSVAVGQRLLTTQAGRLDRIVALELGGKNTSLVLDDCDLERSARAIAFAGFATAGQRCTATSRVVITAGIADAFVARLAELANAIRVGYPFDPDVFMGPMISAEARERLLAAQATARAQGFVPVVPGGAHEVAGHPGYYVRPAIHRAATGHASAPGYSDAELFGPDLAIYVAANLAEALQIANDTRFGLAAAVFTRSRDAFEEAADQLRVGVLHWNRSTAGASGWLPFGGIKDSGNHHPAGILAGAACAFPQAVLLAPTGDEPLPTWPGMPV